MKRFYHFLYQRFLPWLEALVLAFGGAGMLVAGFIDSATTLPPVLLDVLLIEVSIQHPARMPYYVVMTVIGSVLGGLFLYELARKGEEKFYKKRAGQRGAKIREWVARNGFLAVLLGALMPPPMPFKLVVLAAGAAEMPTRPFIFSLTLARVIRFALEGIIAVEYGAMALAFLKEHKLASTIWTIAFGLAFYFVARIVMRPTKEERSQQD
ncbi:MAG: VTT domain-containing protein [Candidatus Acidiferrales bacterium]|jgi:membrane protein YqaA with SNARE-associated domain